MDDHNFADVRGCLKVVIAADKIDLEGAVFHYTKGAENNVETEGNDPEPADRSDNILANY